MKRLFSVAVALGCLGLATLPATAADVTSGFTVHPPGADSCGAWTQGREGAGKGNNYSMTQAGAGRLSRESWVLGYITALNVMFLPKDRDVLLVNLSEGTDNAGLFAWIDNYCAAHPLSDLFDATNALAVDLIDKWHTAHPRR